MSAVRPRTVDDTLPRVFDGLRWMSTAWALVPILLAVFVVYAPTLADWFVGDDFWFLRPAQQHSVGREIIRSFDYRNVGTSLEFDRYRPLYPIAWRLQFAIFGLHAFPYHAGVLALHLACGPTIWFIARRLFPETWQANLAALVFGLHPAYMDAVASIAAANRVFAALPYLLALLCYMRSRDHGQPRRRAVAFRRGRRAASHRLVGGVARAVCHRSRISFGSDDAGGRTRRLSIPRRGHAARRTASVVMAAIRPVRNGRGRIGRRPGARALASDRR